MHRSIGGAWRTGRIIQIAACRIAFDARVRVVGVGVGVGETRSWLEDPGEPLSPEISRLTGLADADLAGQRIDDDAVARLLTDVVVVVAHDACFARHAGRRAIRWPEPGHGHARCRRSTGAGMASMAVRSAGCSTRQPDDPDGRWIKKPHLHVVVTNRFWRAGRRTGEPNAAWLSSTKQRQKLIDAWEAISN